MKVVNGTSYNSLTSDDLIALLESCRASGQRVKLVYGDPGTNIPWPPGWGEDRGRIGRSGGTEKVPLLVKTSRSLGGEAILDHCIMEVRESVGGKVLWKRK